MEKTIENRDDTEEYTDEVESIQFFRVSDTNNIAYPDESIWEKEDKKKGDDKRGVSKGKKYLRVRNCESDEKNSIRDVIL